MPQIICKNAAVGYGKEAVTSGINFTVSRGDYLCIVGENGSGKSTLIKTILKLVRPIEGSIETGDGLLPSRIGYLPQHSDLQQDFPASVREVVLSGCAGQKRGLFYGKREKELADFNMKRLGISDIAKKSLFELSGGQRQRVFLARALCGAEDIILLDEPANGLDPRVRAELYEILGNLNKNDGVTVVMVSHDIAASLGYATHILHIGDKQLFYGTAADYIKSGVGKAFADAEVWRNG